MGYNARNDEIRDNVTRMQRDLKFWRNTNKGETMFLLGAKTQNFIAMTILAGAVMVCGRAEAADVTTQTERLNSGWMSVGRLTMALTMSARYTTCTPSGNPSTQRMERWRSIFPEEVGT
jgi:hypothetical protein